MIKNYTLRGRDPGPRATKSGVTSTRSAVSRQSHRCWQVSLLLLFVLFGNAAWSQIALPYNEYFTGITAANGFPTVTGGAWTRQGSTGNQPTYIANQTTYNRSGNGDSKFIAFRYDAGTRSFFVGPFALTSGVSYTASALYKADGLTGFGPLDLRYGTTAAAGTQTNVIASVAANITNADYQMITGAFTPGATGNYYLSIRSTQNDNPWYLCIDDFKLNVTPACVAPLTATALTAGSTTANLAWSATAASNGYEYAVTASATPPASGTATTSTSVTGFGGLTAATTYYLHVRGNCGGNGFSAWKTSAAFTTACAEVNPPYTQDFSSATVPALPSCTSRQNSGSGNNWVTSSTVYTGVFPSTQGNYLLYSYNSASAANTWFFTRGINLVQGTNYRIKYKYGNDGGATYPEKMKVAYGVSPIASAMTNPLADHSSIVTTNNQGEVTFTPAATGAYYFGFNCYSAADMDILQLDDIVVEVAPSCTVPLSLTASNVTFNSAALSWSPPLSGAALGYEYAISTSAAPPATGTATTATSVPASGLPSETVHYLHVRSHCGTTEFSEWATLSFYTGYCLSQATSPSTGYITSFSTTGGYANINNTSTYGATGYSNFTSMAVSNEPNKVTNFSLTPSTGTAYYYGMSIFADLNNDMDFDDAGERLYSAPASNFSSPLTGSFTIPTGTAAGNYRMRVKIDYITYTTPISPCGTATASETEDYTLTVVPVQTCLPTTAITASALSNSGATLAWTVPATAPAVGYEWAVTTSSTPPASGTFVATNTTPVSVLSSNTQYYAHVRSVCVTGSDYSFWTTQPFRTLCDPISTLPYVQGFEGTGVPQCWTSQAVSGAGFAIVSSITTEIPAAHGGSTFAGIAWASSAAQTGLYVSPGFNLTATPTRQSRVNVWIYRNTLGLAADAITINVNSQPNMTGAQQLLSVSHPTTGTAGWVNYTVNVPTSFNTSVFYILVGGNVTTSFSSYSVGFDDFTLEFAPPAITGFSPATVCSANLATTTVTLTGTNFTGATSVDVNGVSTPFTVVNDTTIQVNLTSATTGGTFTVHSGGTGVSATPLVVNASPVVSAIQNGNVTLCQGTTVDLDNASPGGIWSSGNTSVASIDGNGIVTALSAGTSTISYSVTDNGCTTTVTTTISVNGSVTSTNPAAQTVVTGDTAVFSATATGTVSGYQWQVSTDGGDTFGNLAEAAPYSGTTTATLTISNTPDTFNENLYRLVVHATAPCADFESGAAILNVGDTGIVTHPASITQCSSALSTAVFTVVASGTVDSYTWQADSGLGFQTISNGTVGSVTYSGATTSQLTVSGLSSANTGTAYRVIVEGPANSAISNAALYTVVPAVAISEGPASTTVCGSGSTAMFNAVTSGSVSSVAWQYSSDNVSFANVSNNTPVGATYSGQNTAALQVSTTAATPASGTYFYRMVAQGNAGCSPATSSSAQLSIVSPAIAAAPVATSVFTGSSATFTVATSASAPTYQWQYATAVGGTYANVVDATPAGLTYSGATSATLTVNASATAVASTARYYRVIVTSNGCSTTTAGAQLTVAAYCVPTTSIGNAGDIITNVVLQNTTQSTSFTQASGGASPWYTLYNNTPLNVTQGDNMSVSITFGTDSTQYSAVWIDYNKNGVFEASEAVGVATAANGGSSTKVYTFAVPVTATPGATRIRIRGGSDTAHTAAGACTSTEYGETEDYNLNILTAPACSGTPVAGTVTASQTSVCGSGSVTLTAAGYSAGVTGISLQWYNTATGVISGATSATYTTPVLTAAASYFVRVTCANGGSSDSNTVAISINNPSITSTVPGSRCGTGTVTLGAVATSGSNVIWYPSATGGSALFTGSNFTTPTIAATTTYYAEAGGAAGFAGITANATSTNGTNVGSHGVAFTTTVANVGISSINIPFTGTGTITFAIKDVSNSTVLSSFVTGTVTGNGLTPVNVPVSLSVATPGSYLLIVNAVSGTVGNLGYSTTTFPYSTLSGGFSITSGYWYGTDSATLLYISGVNVYTGCPSPSRTAVVATVNTPPALSLSASTATICAGNSASAVTLTSAASNFDTYVWSPATGVTGNAASGWVFSPSATTAYTLTATNTTSGCANTAAFAVTVNPLPVTYTIASAAMCSTAAPVQLTASFGTNVTTGCLLETNGQYPSGTIAASACNGTTATVATTIGYTGEYSRVALVANNQYVFTSSGAGDLVTISNGAGTAVLAAGPSPLTYISTTSGNVRFYSQTTSCTAESVDRTRSFTCSPLPSMIWTPATGLYTNAAGTVPYTGTSAFSVYAKPSATTTYTATTTTSTGCTRAVTATVTVTVATTWYVDADGDHYGNSGLPTVLACTQPAGYAAVGGDCDDFIAAINPGTPEILYNGVDDNCSGTIDEGHQLLSQVLSSQCGTTLASISSYIGALSFSAPVDGYRFRVVNTATNAVQVFDSPYPHFQLTSLASYDYATTYSISVMLRRNGIWLGYYGSSCLVSTPAVLDPGGSAAVSPSQCGGTLAAISTLIATTSLPGVSNYRFRVTNITDGTAPYVQQELERTTNWFALTMLPRFNYGTAYQVEVAVKTANGNWSGYGAPCLVSSPVVPTLTNCGAVITSAGATIPTASKDRAQAYRFEITNLSTFQQITVDRASNWFTFNNVPGYVAGGVYAVRVAIQTSGYWSPFGEACEVTAPGAARTQVKDDVKQDQTAFNAVVSPNPYGQNFGLALETPIQERILVKVYDMIGKLIDTREFDITTLEAQRFGDAYPSGVYNIVLTQGEYVKTLRVIKR